MVCDAFRVKSVLKERRVNGSVDLRPARWYSLSYVKTATGVTLMGEGFFDGVEQFEAFIGDKLVKSPTFYRDAASFTLILPANLMALRRILPDPRLVPAQVLPGVGAVMLTALDYKDTDLGPYKEFSLGIALNSPDFLQIPCYNFVRQALRGTFHSYIQQLPVTTEIALRGGVDLYNFPKFIARIDLDDDDGWTTCEVSEGDDLICRVKCRRVPTPRSGIIKMISSTYQFQQPQSCELKINANGYAMTAGRGNAELVVGESHPVARELSGLLLSTTPIAYTYVPNMEAILYGPEHLSLAAIGMFLERACGLSMDDLRALVESRKAGKKAAGKKAGKKAAAKKSALQKAIDEAAGTLPEA